MKRQILLFILATFSIIVNAKPKSNIDSLKINSLKNDVSVLKNEINEIKDRQQFQTDQINSQTGMLDTAFDGVSGELSASSNFIGIFGIIIAIFSIGLSIYVSRIEKNVKAMRGDSETLLMKNIQIRQEMEALSEKITKDSVGLYKLVRNEESNHLMERLISVPEDIINLATLLVSRDLELELFAKLKEAFLQVKDNPKYDIIYAQVFFQHFSGKAILDNDVKPVFIKWLDHSFMHAFKNDAIKSAKDYFNAILEKGLTESKAEINNYVKGISKSPFSREEAVYYAILNEMKNQELKFGLYDLVKKDPETLIFRQIFGKLLTEFKFENLTAQESAILTDINNLITA